jgi:hypothetical protein
MLSEELGDGDGDVTEPDPGGYVDEPPTPDEAPPPHLPPLSPTVLDAPGPPASAAAFDMQAFAALLAGAMGQSGQATAQAIREGLSDATAMARDPIPENKISPGHSVYSHADGDQKRPRTLLRCPMFLGIYDDKGEALGAFELENQTLTEWERDRLNALRPGVYAGIERNNGDLGLWRVVEKHNDNGEAQQLIVAVPPTWLSRDEFQYMPTLKNALRQMHEQVAV